MMSRRVFPLAAVWLVLFGQTPGISQTTFGTITGNVKDASGAALAGASVVVTNQNTGAIRQVTTDDAGRYLIPSVLPGAYTITSELTGFKKAVVSGVTLEVNQTLRVDLTLQVGEVSETVEVEGAAPLLQTETSTVGTVISNKQVIELPLNGRSFTQLTLLVPGAVPEPNPSFLTSGTNVSVSGTRTENNNFTLDGITNNET